MAKRTATKKTAKTVAAKTETITDKDPTLNEQNVKHGEGQYQPSDLAQKKIKNNWARFVELQQLRDQRFRFFNGWTLLEIIDESQKRFNLWLREREAEEWQTMYVGPTIRNKVLAILARLASQRMKRSWYGTINDNKYKARICRVMDEAAAYLNDDEQQFFFEMLAAIVKPKVIGYESYAAPVVKYHEITGYDPATGDIQFELKTKKDFQDVFGVIVPTEDFYPGDLRKRRIKQMPDCAWATRMSRSDFDAEFSKYKNHKYVKNGGECKEDPFYKDYLPTGLKDDEIFVLRYFKKPGATPDCMDIQANGVLLTPDVSPLPWNHKTQQRGLPFWEGGMEPYDEHFFYDMPMPIKLRGDSDVSDAALRMAIDQLYLALNPPILSTDPENVEDKELGPGVVYEVSDPEGTREMKLQGPNAQTLNYIKLMASNMNLSSVDNVTQGNAAAGGNQTATEIDAAQQGAAELMSQFLRFMEWSMKEKGMLRMANMQQFYPLPMGVENGKPKYRELRVDNVPQILTGKMGSVKVTFVPNKMALPPTPTLAPEERARLAETYGEDFDEIVVRQSPNNPKLEEVWLTADYMRDFSAGCVIIPNSSIKVSDAVRRAQELEYQKGAFEMYGDLLDRKKMFREYSEAYDKDADEFLLEENAQGGPDSAIPPELQALGEGLDEAGPTTGQQVNKALTQRGRQAAPQIVKR